MPSPYLWLNPSKRDFIVPGTNGTTEPIDKVTFGSMELGPMLQKWNQEEEIESITLIGLCTDICVISNAMICI